MTRGYLKIKAKAPVLWDMGCGMFVISGDWAKSATTFKGLVERDWWQISRLLHKHKHLQLYILRVIEFTAKNIQINIEYMIYLDTFYQCSIPSMCVDSQPNISS